MAKRNKKNASKLNPSDIKDINSLFGLNKKASEQINTLTYGTSKDLTANSSKVVKDMLTYTSGMMKDIDNVNGKPILMTLTNMMDRKNKGSHIQLQNIRDLFENNNNVGMISEFYTENTARALIYSDYEIISTCLPQVKDAINIMRDEILSPDDFTKEILSFKINGSLLTDKTLSEKLDTYKKKYKLDKKIKTIVENTLIYGEQFVSVVPYSYAFDQILKEKEKRNLVGGNPNQLFDFNKFDKRKTSKNESSGMLIENLIPKDDIATLTSSLDYNNVSELNEALTEICKNVSVSDGVGLIYENDISALQNFHESNNNDLFADIQQIPSFFNKKQATTDKSQEGMMDKEEPDVSGAIVKTLDVKRVVPIIVNEICLGYYYIETKETENLLKNPGSHVHHTGIQFRSNIDGSLRDRGQVVLYKAISNYIYQQMDKKFIEDNAELKDFIYQFVKDNESIDREIRVSYLPPNHVIHFKINEDENGRGTSVLAPVVFFAKIYLSMFITNIMMYVTRSADRKVYYVKQHIGTDVAESIQDAVKELKKDQLGFNDINNMGRIFSVLGRFRDSFIPVDDSEGKPITTDILSGQDVQMQTEMLEMLEKLIVNGIGPPSSITNYANDIEFAKMISTANGKFLRLIISIQMDLADSVDIMTKRILWSEKLDSTTITSITTLLPAPSSLHMSNLIEQFTNTQNLIQNITTVVHGENYDSNQPEIRKFIFNLYKKYMQNVEWDEFEEIHKLAIIQAEKEKYEKKIIGDDDNM